jgi:hypothetical protein
LTARVRRGRLCGTTMLGLLFEDLLSPGYLLSNPWFLVATAFQLWMLVDAIRRQEWLWAVLILLFSALTAVFYYFLVYRPSAAPAPTTGFELPGAYDRSRIKELEDRIHHLDKAHHHAELGNIYFQQGRLAKAEACYRAALEREPDDPDTLAHLGQCLLRLGRAQESRPLLERVVANDPKHEYGHTLMALAETLAAQGEKQAAIAAWERVLEHNSYARARVQLAELLAQGDERDRARALVQEVLADDLHAPAFQRRKERPWVSRAKSLLRQL